MTGNKVQTDTVTSVEVPPTVRSVLLAAGVCAATLGFLVLGSWLTGSAAGTIGLRVSDPMPFNTALGFVVLGLALVAFAAGQLRLAIAAGWLSSAYGALTLIQHITGSSLNLDSLFFAATGMPEGFIGRAAPNTGLTFMMLGAAVGTLAVGRGITSRTTGGLLGAATAVVAVVDLVGHVIGTGVWHPIMPQMALHTAIGFALLGGAVLYAGWATGQGIGRLPFARPGLVIGVAVTLLSILLAQLLRLQERRQILETAKVAAQAIADQLARSFDGRAATVLSIARAMTTVDPAGWRTFSEAVVDPASSRRGVGWIDGRGPRWLALVPESPLHQHPWWPDSALRAAADTAAAPVMAVRHEGSDVFLAHLMRSHTRDGQTGYFWAVTDLRLALDLGLRRAPEPFTLTIRDEESELYRSPHRSAADSSWAREATVDVPPVHWVVTAGPTPNTLHTARSPLPIVTLTAGMLVATLLGVTVTLGRAARLRAGEIEAAHAQLTREIHEREAAQAALRVSEEQLRQAHKLEAVGRLAGGIAHDYNNILTVIRGNARSLLLQERLVDLARDALEHIDRAAARGSLLTARLLSFSQRQILQPEPIALGELVASLERELVQLLGPHIALHLERDPGSDVVEVDRRWLSQVILDLSFNAREAMPAGGTLWIRTRPGGPDIQSSYGVTPFPRAAMLLEIEDSGRGMDDATRTRLFEPFFSTKKFGQGAGLALASAYGIVRQSHGDIAVRSAPGAGTRIGIFLPSATAEAVPVDLPIAPGTTILIAEDEPGVLRFMRRTLEHAGCRVIAGASGEAALAALAESTLTPDLLVSDIVMPGMSGVELADHLRLQVPGLTVLFVSAYTSDALKERGIESLGAYLLQKPFTADELLEQIGRTLALSVPRSA